MNTFDKVWKKLQEKEYRTAFVEAQFKRSIPFQIRALRSQRGWSQEQLAERSQLTQGVVSRAEDSDYGNLTVNTILKIAHGFDVAFVGRFVPFSELDEWFIGLSEDRIKASSFEQEDRLLRSAKRPRRKALRGRRISRPSRTSRR